MFSCTEYVTLSDDEPVQVKSLSNRDNGSSSDIETIVLDEAPNRPRLETNIIDLTDAESVARQFKPIDNFSVIYTENKLFAEFLLKCLDLEMSDGMIRIINKSLVKAYEKTEVGYRNSPQFYSVVVRGLDRLKNDPAHKFSHVKDMIETLKLHVHKKRAQLITLETNLKRNCIKKKKVNRKPKTIVIDSDDEPGTINLDDDDVLLVNDNQSEEKENNSNKNHSQSSQLEKQTAANENVNRNVKHNPSTQKSNQSGLEANSSQNHNLLEPKVSVPLSSNESGNQCVDKDNKEAKIKYIEERIKSYKDLIEKCEEAEVMDDSIISPYIQCDFYKREIVKLYKELCHLVGEDPVKKRTVRLQVLEGHPAGPVRRLEQFINDNIGEDGTPLFPDFCDVVQCVIAANLEEKLGWDKKMVMKEANYLFTQCGRALQKQRQRREYREQILTRIKDEELHDPADDDPELLARLEENQRIALKKENDLLERYSRLQSLPSHILRPGPSIENNNNTEISCKSPEIDDDDEDSNFEPPSITLSQQSNSIEDNVNENKEIVGTENKQVSVTEEEINSVENKEVKIEIKQEPMDVVEMLEKLGNNCEYTILDIEDPFLVIDISSDSSDGDVTMDDDY